MVKPFYSRNSVEGESSFPRDVASAQHAVNLEASTVIEVRSLGMFKFLITFEYGEELLDVLQNGRDWSSLVYQHEKME